MRPMRVYVDTSVFGGVRDEGFAEPTALFLAGVTSGRYVILLSSETVRELSGAPREVRGVVDGLPPGCLEAVHVTSEVEALAEAYVSAGIVSRRCWTDALHVACATVARADLILSWNFKHIVNFDRIRKYNGVNALRGYGALEIRSPLEVSDADEGEEI